MKRHIFTVCLLLLCAIEPVMAKGTNLRIRPEHPIAGNDFTIFYEPKTSVKSLSAEIFLYSGFHWKTVQLPLKKLGNNFSASLKIPGNCAYFALRFVADGKLYDVNGKNGYTYQTRNKSGGYLPGASLGPAILGTTKFGLSPEYFQVSDSKTPSELQSAIDAELKHPSVSIKQFVATYLSIQRIILKGDFAMRAPEILVRIMKQDITSEDDLSTIQRIYKFEVKDAQAADLISSKILNLYPKGKTARMMAFSNLTKVVNKDSLILNANNFLKEFPKGQASQNLDRQEFIYYELGRILAAAYFDTKRFSEFLSYSTQQDFRYENEIYRWNILRAYTFKTVPLEDLCPIAEVLMKQMVAKVNDGSFGKDRGVGSIEANALAQKQLDDRLATHISMLYDYGNYKRALEYFNHFSKKAKFADAQLNELHWKLLEKTDQKSQVLNILEQSINANAYSQSMIEKLKALYDVKTGSTKGFDEYLTELKSTDESKALRKYVQAHLVSQEVMPFALEDMKGNLVRSSDWEGKIVVIDFWATWCRPCIMAFPGMQMAVDKYANDQTVDFYFIATMQFGDYKEKVTKFISEEGYRFKVLHDGINSKTNAQDAVFSTLTPFFKSSAIPRKIILKDGIMRYTTEGYSGSPSKLLDEISYAIEILKSEK